MDKSAILLNWEGFWDILNINSYPLFGIQKITVVILFGPKKWDGPRNLHEMVDTDDPDVLSCMADYKINLIEPAVMSEDDLAKLQSTLKAVLGFIKYSSDSDALDAFLAKEKTLYALDVEAARVISVCTNTRIDIEEDSEVVDVCKAVQDMTNKARQESRLETLRDDVKNVMVGFKVTLEDAMKVLKVSKEDQAILRKMI